MSKVKILLVGSVGDKLSVLRKKLQSLNDSKAGPFDACFCVGPADLGAYGTSTEPEAETKAFPMPVYFQEANAAAASVGADDQGIVSLGGASSNLYHLRGNNNNGNGLQAFRIKLGNGKPLRVASCPRHYRAPARESHNLPERQLPCDLLLSSDWPQGMEDVLNTETEPLSYDVAEAALACTPRYHLCPSSALFHASPPYRLPGSDHPGRFLALAGVRAGKTPKPNKFVHALGLVPLASGPEPQAAPSTLPCPFARGDSPAANASSGPQRVPEFARRGDAGDAAYSRFGGSKRGREAGSHRGDQTVSLEPPDDPTVSTLFLYGLHRDVTGELQSTRSPKVLLAFGKYGVTKVRHPPSVPTSTYCFLEFPSQAEAAKCLLDCNGRITIDSVNLTLKWATKAKQQQQHPPHAQNDHKRQRREQQQHFVTQEEAKDSTTLFFHPPRNTKLVANSSSSSSSNSSKAAEPTREGTSKASDQSTTTANDESNKSKSNDESQSNAATEDSVKAKVDSGTDQQNDETAAEVKAQGTDAEQTDNGKKSEDTNSSATDATTSNEGKGGNNHTGPIETADAAEIDSGDVDAKPQSNKPTGFAATLRDYVQSVLEDALNDGVEKDEERVTADSEPALRVEVRCKDQYGFLEFASHAAATMALAAITKSTDGGLLAEGGGMPKDLVGTTLRWAKGSASSATGNKNHARKGGREQVLEALGMKRQYYPADGRKDCWFCLSSPTCETHLITGVYDDWYATMPKGPVHQGHVLLVPVEHTSEGAWTLNEEWIKLVEKTQKHASQTYDSDLFVFERAMETRGGYHTHIQCVPIPRDSSTKLQTTMMAHATASGFDLRPIQSDLGVKALLEKGDSYFYAEIRTRSHQHRFLYKRGDETGSGVPLQFAREVLASVLGNPKLAHWKACVVDKEQETNLASAFRDSFNAM